jgi:hypothetical protein
VAVYLDHGRIPTCADCKKYVYDEHWEVSQRAGKPNLRPRGASLPCIRCPKADQRQPNPGADMTGRNWLTLQCFWRARAGAPMPSDSLLWQNLGLVQGVYESIRHRQAEAAGVASSLLTTRRS